QGHGVLDERRSIHDRGTPGSSERFGDSISRWSGMAPRAPRPSAALPVARTVHVAGQSIRGTATASCPSGPSHTSVLIPPWLELVARVPVVVTLTRQRLTRSGRAAVNR